MLVSFQEWMMGHPLIFSFFFKKKQFGWQVTARLLPIKPGDRGLA